jgi:hypothetical protein
VSRKEAVIKALNRMAAAGKIAKLAKGKFYKQETTPFGILQPKQYQVVKDLLEKDGKLTGYLTGYSIYNSLGLTTQVSNTIQIGSNDIRASFIRGRYTISFVRQKNTITKDNIPLLQILDSIRYIKKIPDTKPQEAGKRILAIIGELDTKKKQSMVRLALKYPPATRALLGALLEKSGDDALAESLKKTLNPITTYNLPGILKVTGPTNNWNIK